MTKTYLPFDAGAGSGVTEAMWSKMARYWVTSGVLAVPQGLPTLSTDPLLVFGDSSGRQVKVNSGSAWVMGHYYENDAQEILAIAPADATNPRIDRVVLRLNWSANIVDTAVIPGTPAATPIAPDLVRDTTSWDVPLALVRVNAAVVTITAGNVTPGRLFAGSVDNPVIFRVDPLLVASPSIDITGIPAVFRTLEIKAKLRGDVAAVSTSFRLRFNGDTGAFYDVQLAAFPGTSSTVTQNFGQSSINLGPMPGGSALANLFSVHKVEIIGYSDDQNKQVIAETTYKHNITTGTMENDQEGGHWRNNGAITSMSLFPLAGNFAPGSFLEMYGRVR